MKHSIFLSLLLSVTPYGMAAPSTQSEWTLPIVRVVDGDTIETEMEHLPPPLNKMSIRVLGIDTPEKGGRAQCELERKLGEKATLATKFIVGKATSMSVSNCKHDKFGGRIDCDVMVNGKDLRTELIKHGLAREYHGEKKQSWCSSK